MPFGNPPIVETIILSLGADFTQELQAPPGELIPEDSTVVIKFYPPNAKNTLTAIAECEGVVTPEGVSFRLESEDADDIPDKARFRIYINYPEDPTLNHVWFRGTVKREQ